MSKKNNINFWNIFYKKKLAPVKPSSFAKFSFKRIEKMKYITFDIGCGNGRDTIFFNKNNIECFGIDKSKEATLLNKKKYFNYSDKFLNRNFCTFFKKKIKKKFIVFSRFTWHSIDYKDERNLLNSLKKNKNLEFIFIEARSIKDGIYGKGKKIGTHEFLTSHYRRFISSKVLINQLSKFCKILYFKESKNLAKFKNENPHVIRIIAKRKKFIRR